MALPGSEAVQQQLLAQEQFIEWEVTTGVAGTCRAWFDNSSRDPRIATKFSQPVWAAQKIKAFPNGGGITAYPDRSDPSKANTEKKTFEHEPNWGSYLDGADTEAALRKAGKPHLVADAAAWNALTTDEKAAVVAWLKKRWWENSSNVVKRRYYRWKDVVAGIEGAAYGS